jgi:hypothetical protein
MSMTPPGSTVVWAPEDLPLPPEQLAGFGYVVVEETVGRLLLLLRWSWPQVDQRGRLVWLNGSDCTCESAALDIELVRAQLYTPNRLRRRPRCGDTFAVPDPIAPGWQSEQELDDLRQLFPGPVYDISADAREAARFAYHAGLGAVAPAGAIDEQARAEQTDLLSSRATRPLRALRIAAPSRRPR